MKLSLLAALLIVACSLSSVISFFGEIPSSTPPSMTQIMSTTMPHGTPTSPVIARVAVDKLNLRTCPGEQCGVVSVLRANDAITVLSCWNVGDSVWCAVKHESQYGYVNSSYILFR